MLHDQILLCRLPECSFNRVSFQSQKIHGILKIQAGIASFLWLPQGTVAFLPVDAIFPFASGGFQRQILLSIRRKLRILNTFVVFLFWWFLPAKLLHRFQQKAVVSNAEKVTLAVAI